MTKRFFATIASIALLFTACDMLTDETPAPAAGKFQLTNGTEFTSTAAGNCFNANYVIDEAVEGATMTATPKVDWIHLNGDITDSTIPFCVDNNYGDARTGTLEIKYAEATATITVHQDLNRIRLSKSEIEAGCGGMCYPIDYTIVESVDDAIVIVDPQNEWIHLNGEVTETTISICVDDNTGEARTGTVKVTYAGDPAVITINQKAASATEE